MANVFEFPPVSYQAAEHTVPDINGLSYGIDKKPYGSQFGPIRREVVIDIHGVGRDGHAMGRVEALKEMMRGQLQLTRIPLPDRHWFGASGSVISGGQPLSWTTGGDPLGWADDGVPLEWRIGFSAVATPGVTNGVNWIDVTGLPANVTVSIPGLSILCNGVRALCTQTVVSASSGSTRIFLTNAVTAGQLEIGTQEYGVFLCPTLPRAVQNGAGSFSYVFNLVEQFEAQYSEGFTVINPW